MLSILKGKNEKSQIALDKLKERYGEHPWVCWYPSSGLDFRDLIELDTIRAKKHHIKELPDIFVHSDYFLKKYLKEVYFGVPYFDENTVVKIHKIYELEIKTGYRFYISPAFVDFRLHYRKPIILLLDVLIRSNILGVIRKPLIYFSFENINFLEEILLKNNINVSHIVKVREGCGFGGNRKSISIAYMFLSYLKTKYLLIDCEEHTDFKLLEKLQLKHSLTPLSYNLDKLYELGSWSGRKVNIFKVTYNDSILDFKEFEKILNLINICW